ncbi:MAG: serine hydrolase domain-containing protein, partial [Nitrososphaerota archaeon]
MNAKLVRAITLLLGACLLLAGMSTFPINVQARSNESSSQAIDAYIASRMQAAHIPGLSLAVVKGDQIAYLKGYGHADPSGHPVTPQTPFIIGSISKTFTALALMQLVEAGKVDVDAPVQRYLPWFSLADSHASARITVRNLLNQTSGIPQLQDSMLWTDLD